VSVVAEVLTARETSGEPRTFVVICGNCGEAPLIRQRCGNCGSDTWVTRNPFSFEDALRRRRDREAREWEREEANAE
jgi:rRNA maturation protein Nop10